MRIGIGYDVHKLVRDRKLIIGGVDIPHDMGLYGHSDADVLVHAIIDAILGAAGLGDIGRHFPDSEQEYKGISSIELLARVSGLIKEKGYNIINIDSVIIAQKPKLSSYIDDMERNISRCLGLEPSDRCVNVKATTEEWLGFTGREEGIAAKAVCLIENAK